MSDLTCRRWTKDGKDRIYVNAVVDGSRESVGFVDVLTGYTKSSFPGVSPQDVYAAAATFAVSQQIGLPAPKFDTRGPVTQHNADLAANKAGASAGSASGKRGLLSRLVGKKPDAWEVGAKGESVVGRLFDKAPDIKVLHSVVVNEHGADIDHVLFTPYGIYTVNTKTHHGAHITVNTKGFFVSGTAVSHVSKARVEAERVSRILTATAKHEIPVTPVIVIVGTDDVTVTANTGVLICTVDSVLTALRGRSTRLTEEQVDWLYQKARDPQTWSRR